MTRAGLALAIAAGCRHPAPIESCAQNLEGEYVAGDRHWMVVDRGTELDVYPLFRDLPVVPALEVAPRFFELAREGGAIRGSTRRRYLRGGDSCVARLPATIARCAGDTLEVVHAETAPPLDFAPCRWGTAEPARVERWRRR